MRLQKEDYVGSLLFPIISQPLKSCLAPQRANRLRVASMFPRVGIDGTAIAARASSLVARENPDCPWSVCPTDDSAQIMSASHVLRCRMPSAYALPAPKDIPKKSIAMGCLCATWRRSKQVHVLAQVRSDDT